ncbi:hypothetical protein Celaphus_00015189 [Cervus elaphus hippelaphus]|uniref:Uncharacterized protein n=1 Tax=Cervus elaphus hippelaphus TaxID=46360 RepID=A0A212CSE7_CEREH|nr:hypothetical protein Celaphus_00015189 [Cervus elaphus hippelaphus]
MPDHHSTMSTNRTFTLSVSASLDTIWFYFCLPQLFSTCVAFSLVASMGIGRGDVGNWSMAVWCFCFAVTLIIFIAELCKLHALVLWPLYQFYEKLGGKPQRSSDEDCIDGLTAYMCTWEQ